MAFFPQSFELFKTQLFCITLVTPATLVTLALEVNCNTGKKISTKYVTFCLACFHRALLLALYHQNAQFIRPSIL